MVLAITICSVWLLLLFPFLMIWGMVLQERPKHDLDLEFQQWAAGELPTEQFLSPEGMQ